MRRTSFFLFLALLIAVPLSSMQEKQTVETPGQADIPQPVPGEVSLAGAWPPDITRFLHVRRASSPSLAPDGARLSFRTSISGQPQLWVVDAAGGWPAQLTFGESVTFNKWSPTGEWIAYGSDRGGNEREGFYLISPDGTQERELLAPSEAFRDFGGFSPDGTRIAYATTERNGVDYDIHILDLASGQDRKVYEGKFGFFVATWRPDGDALLLTETRGEDANNVYLLDLATGRAQTLFKPKEAAAYLGFQWKPDGSGFYLATDQGRDFKALAYFDLAGKELIFLETPDHDVEQVALSRDGRYLAWTLNQGGYSRLFIRDLETRRDRALSGLPRGVYSFAWAPGTSVAAITVRGPQVPGDIWTWDAATGELRRATRSSTAGLDMSRMVIPEHVDFPARDGVTLHGLLYLPSDLTSDRKPPVLLAVHGGPTSQARPVFDADLQYLLARGIAVFELNFRGSTGYGKRFARLDNQRLRPNAVRDMEDAVRWLRRHPQLDATRVAVMGGSYGGYMTLAAVTTFPDLFRAGVAAVGVSNWITAPEGAAPDLKASDRLEYGDVKSPRDRAFFRELSPLTHVKRVRAPLMVLHGANDPRDPVTESDQFVRAVRANGGRVDYLRFPDEGHGIRKLANRIIAYRRIAAFLERHLGVHQGGQGE